MYFFNNNNELPFFKFLTALLLLAVTFTANAQKRYTQGKITYNVISAGITSEYKLFFHADSNTVVEQVGPALVKKISIANDAYYAILSEVAAADWRRAAVLTQAEIAALVSEKPKFIFTPTTDTKLIGKYNSKKVTAKDIKTGSSMDIWVTTDILVTLNSFIAPFIQTGGFPVQFATMVNGEMTVFTLRDISDEKPPLGIFKIPAGYERVTYDEIKQQ